MTWPMDPMPAYARALLLYPCGMRARDRDLAVPYPVPPQIEEGGRRFQLFVMMHAGQVDRETRALYVLGGRYMPFGASTNDDAVPQLQELHDDD